jgi:hypothetical protein
MGINGKYSTGIILTFVLLVAAMLYAFPAAALITGVRGITEHNFSYPTYYLGVYLLHFSTAFLSKKNHFY